MKRQNNPSGAMTKLCPRCHKGGVMVGRQAQYQARSAVDNKPICTDCKLVELLAGASVIGQSE